MTYAPAVMLFLLAARNASGAPAALQMERAMDRAALAAKADDFQAKVGANDAPGDGAAHEMATAKEHGVTAAGWDGHNGECWWHGRYPRGTHGCCQATHDCWGHLKCRTFDHEGGWSFSPTVYKRCEA